MGFKKDLKKAEAWLNWDGGDGPSPARAGFDTIHESDQFCWDLIQRLNKERGAWKETARQYAENADYWRGVLVGVSRHNDNLRAKAEELAAEAAHWKTLAQADEEVVTFEMTEDAIDEVTGVPWWLRGPAVGGI